MLWTPGELGSFLRGITEFQAYAPCFEANSLNGKVALSLRLEDLTSAPFLMKTGHALKFMNILNSLDCLDWRRI